MNESVQPSMRSRPREHRDQGVYTNLADLSALQFKASGFTFLPRQPIHSLLSGRHASRLRGRGLNFEEIRRYLPGDDIRSMDWRVTARARKPHIRVYTEERDRPCLLVVDQRISMFFGSVKNMKSVTATELAALGAWRVLSQKDRVGAIVFNDSEIEQIIPHRSRENVERILGSLVRFNHALSLSARIQSAAGKLNESLRQADRIAKHDYLVCVITDGFGFDQDSRKLMSRIARHNDLLIGLVYDQMEVDLPEAGALVFSNGDQQIEINSSSKRMRERYKKLFEDQLADSRKFLIQRAAPVLPIRTDEGVAEQMQKLVGIAAR